MEPDEPTSTLLLEMVVLVAFFPAFLREYFRIALPPPALCCLLLALDLAVATLRRRNRLPNAMQAVPLAAICFLAVEVAATWHGDAFWPLSHKLAAYTAADLIFAAHQLSLYLAVWTAARLASRFLPSQKPRSARLAFLLCLGAYLTLDRDWFLVSMTHIGLGYVRLMATADGLRHMGMDAKSFRQVAVDLSAFAVAILAPSVIVRGRAA
jgi:hypothetical protein